MRFPSFRLIVFLVPLLTQCGPKIPDDFDVLPEKTHCYFTSFSQRVSGPYKFNYAEDGSLSCLSPDGIKASDTIFFTYDDKKRVTEIWYGREADTLRSSQFFYENGTASWKYAIHRFIPSKRITYDTAFYDAAGQRTLLTSYIREHIYTYYKRYEMLYKDGNIEEVMETTALYTEGKPYADSGKVHTWKFTWEVFDNPYAYFQNLNWGDSDFDVPSVPHTPSRKAPSTYYIYRYSHRNGSWHLSPEKVTCGYRFNTMTGLIASRTVDGDSYYKPNAIVLNSACK
jgi:hypothetical protein